MASQIELFEKLKSFNNEQFQEVLFRLEIEVAYLPENVSQVEKAIEVIKIVEQEGKLQLLESTLKNPAIKKLSSQSAANPIKVQVDQIVSDYTQLFVGRDEEEQQLDDFLTENSSGMLLVRADAGMGKTALLANWKQKQQQQGNCFIAYHFFRQGEETSNVIQAYRYLLRQLYAYYELTTPQIPTNEYELNDRICHLLQEPREGKPLVILLDALDEATPERSLSLTLPQPLPEGLYVIASVRVNEEEKLDNLPPWIQVTKELPLKHLPSPAIAEWLRRAGNGELATLAQDDTFVEQVCDRTEGIPLFLKYLIDELVQVAKRDEESAIRNTLAATPKGFAEYIRQQYQALDRLEDWRSRRDLQKIFYFLSVAKGELSSDDLVELMEESPVGLPWQVSRWFKIRELEDCLLFSFAHPSLAEQFAALPAIKANTKKAQKELIKYCAHWQEYHSAYALRHYAEHLQDVKRWEELYAIARDKNFASAQRQQLPNEPDLPLKTVQLALWGKAETDDAGGIAEFLLVHAQRVLQIAQESPLDILRAGSITGALALAEKFDPERCILWYLLLAWALVTDAAQDMGKMEQAWEILERLQHKDVPRLSELWMKYCAVYLLTPLLTATKARFTELSKRILNDASLAKLCQNFVEGRDFTTALNIARQIEDSYYRAEALIKIAKAQPTAENFVAALDACQINHSYYRAKALVEMAKAQATAKHFAAALNTAQLIDGSFHRGEALMEIAKAQAIAEHFVAALNIARQIEDSFYRAKALMEIAKAQATAKHFAAALNIARQIEDSTYRAEALMEIAKAQPTAENFAVALDTAQLIEDSFYRAEALTEIAKAQPTVENFAAAIKTAQLIDHSYYRAKALIKIAKAQPTAENFATALDTACQDDSYHQGEVLMEIAKAQATAKNFAAAIKTAQLIKDSSYRGEALVEIAKAQPTAENFAAALDTGRQIEDSYHRGEALMEIAKAQATAENFAAAFNTAQLIEDSYYRAKALIKIAKAQATAENFAAGLSTAQLIEDSYHRGEALMEIAKAQPTAEDFDATLNTAQLIDSSEDRAKAQPTAEDFDATLNTAQLIDSSKDRAVALMRIAEAQATAEHFVAALNTVCQIYDSHYQARALIKIAKAQVKAKLSEQALLTAEKIIINRNQHLPDIAAAFTETGDKENFKQLLIPCAYYLDAAYQMCGHLVKLYPAQVSDIAKVVKEFNLSST
jgi:hypothetical protein